MLQQVPGYNINLLKLNLTSETSNMSLPTSNLIMAQIIEKKINKKI